MDHQHTNRLARETSPYLLQHAHNPVDWYPWGTKAFEKARAEDKPVFLSVGYSACHWCHVMERESFENDAIAEIMNRLFVNVKVDREERPDVDEIYMKAVQAMTRSGGWPMSVWMTPEGEPFYGGTYFPPDDRYGRPGFGALCERIGTLWKDNREQLVSDARRMTEYLQESVKPQGSGSEAFEEEVLTRAATQICGAFDSTWGGFGSAPKFPHPMDLSFLLHMQARTGEERYRHVVTFTLDKMAAGGMYDQLGGGFHRYSVDEKWLIPHFEKMLYDNALLTKVYLESSLLNGEADHRRIVEETLGYVLREMVSPLGGFYSTQDADSEGEEGKFFAWDRADIGRVLGRDQGKVVSDYFGVTEIGNFEHGKSALWRPNSREDVAQAHDMEVSELQSLVDEARKKLFEARESRIKPGRDEKILVDWNGMMIGAFARAGFHFNDSRYVETARNAAEFCLSKMVVEGRLRRSFKDGRARFQANLGDYALLIEGLIDLYQATFEPRYLGEARRLLEITRERFWDPESGGFFFTADDHEALIARSKDAYDGATPSAISVQVGNLFRLAELAGEPSWIEAALQTANLYRPMIEQHPRAVSNMVQHLSFHLAKPQEIVLAGESLQALAPMLDALRSRLFLDRVLVVRTPDTAEELEKFSALAQGKTAIDGKPTAYVCQDFRCQAPVHTPEELLRALLP